MALDQHRLGQAQQASRVGEHADDVDASSDFLMQPARVGLWTRSVPVPEQQRGQGEHVGLRIDEHRGDLRMRSAGHRDHMIDPVVQTWCEAREQSRHVGYDAKSVL